VTVPNSLGDPLVAATLERLFTAAEEQEAAYLAAQREAAARGTVARRL